MQHNHLITERKHPDYNLHIPKALTYPQLVGFSSVGLAGLLYLFLHQSKPKLAAFLAEISILLGGVYVGIFALANRFLDLDRRLEARDRLLAEIPWQGNETVLDVGCGNGILIMGAAKRLTTGQGIGIDIWAEFAGDSRPEAFQKNAEIEGVADRVSLENEDVRQLPYDDEFFDVIMTALTMHHISHGADSNKAMQEMTRVLKPGGWLAIYDVPPAIHSCQKLMRENGLEIKKKDKDMIFGIKPHT